MSAINPAINPAINKKEFYDQLTYNLDIMEHTIISGRAHDISLGFIEIFADEIKELENAGFDKAKIHELSARLGADADRICTAIEHIFSPVNADAVRPLVGKSQTLASLAHELTPGFTKLGLEALDKHFSLKRVAGDGHCLFRAIAAGTLDYLEKLYPTRTRAIYGKASDYCR